MMVIATEAMIEEAEAKMEDEAMVVADVTVSTAPLELGPQVIEDMRKEREIVYSKRAFHDADFQDVVDKHERTN